MKKNSQLKLTAAKFSLLAILSASAGVSPALATSELDRQYALESIGYLKSLDNVDGLFAEYVAEAYKDYFSRQSRFVLQDLSKADSVFEKSKLRYGKIIKDPQILGQLARATRTETMIRTKVFKEFKQYRFELEWLHAPKMDLLATETFVLDAPENGKPLGSGDMRGLVHQALDRMIAKVPFYGHVTGRDEKSVTVNIGKSGNVKKGDTLVIATLDEAKRHPLTGTVVDWRMSPVGRVVVESVDDGMAFCRVLDEEKGRQITRYQKISLIMAAPTPVEQPNGGKSQITDSDKDKLKTPPKFGWAALGLLGGQFSRTFSESTTSAKIGTAYYYGVKGDGEVWLTRSIFLNAEAGFGSYSYSTETATTASDGTTTTGTTASSAQSGSLLRIGAAAGYRIYVSGDFFGPTLSARGGFRVTNYTLPISAPDRSGPNSYKSAFLGLGADLPLRARFGFSLAADFAVYKMFSETNASGSIDTTNDFNFLIGSYFKLNPKMTVRVGLDVQITSADFAESTSFSQRAIAITPALLYYF